MKSHQHQYFYYFQGNLGFLYHTHQKFPASAGSRATLTLKIFISVTPHFAVPTFKLAFYCCYDKGQQIQWLKETEVYYLVVIEIQILKWISVGHDQSIGRAVYIPFWMV